MLGSRRFARAVVAAIAAVMLAVLILPGLSFAGAEGRFAGLSAAIGGLRAAAAGWQLPAVFEPAPATVLQSAVAKVRAAGSYRFVAESRQVLLPRAMPGTIGQQSQQLALSSAGEVVLPSRAHVAMTLRAEGQGEPTTASLVRDKGRTFVDSDGKLVPLGGQAGMDSPTPDLMTYLAAAKNVTRQAVEDTAAGRVTRYRFELDGPAFARHVRDLLAASMADEMPADMTLQPPKAYTAMTGWGELWVDAEGLPRRQILHFTVPGLSAAYDGAADLTVDFKDIGAVHGLPGAVQSADGNWHLEAAGPGTPPAWLLGFLTRSGPQALGLALLLALAALSFTHRRRKGVYATIVALVLGSMIMGPLVRVWGVSLFQARLAHAASTPVTAAGNSTDASAQGSLLAGNHGTATAATAQQARLSAALAPQAAPTPTRACTEANSPTADADGDKLSDQYEGCLGTDPENADSDGDMINDRLEVTGIKDAAGETWTSDPVRGDSNNDGATDRTEWPTPHGVAPKLDVDGDGLPNFWDDDNDGDLVPDGKDLSPNAVSGYTPKLDLSVVRPAADITDTQSFALVTVQVQPQNTAHIRYALSKLDWPPDTEGQIQNLGSVDKDVTLVPLLVIKSNLSPSQAQRYGVSIAANKDSDKGTYPYILYMPLDTVGDGGTAAAFYGRLAYTPQEAASIQWSAQLSWMVQGRLDTWKNCAANTTPSAANCNGYDTKTQVIQIYTESQFRVTGLSVDKSRDVQIATFGTPQSANNDAYLFQLMMGLSASYLVSATQTLTQVVKTFRDPNAKPADKFNITTPVVSGWSGDDPFVKKDYGYRDIAWATTAQTTTIQFLTKNYKTSDNPSLVYAFQETAGSADLTDATLGLNGATITASFSLGKVSTIVQRGLRLTMYQYQANYWAALGYRNTLAIAEAREANLSDWDKFMMAYFYSCFNSGQTTIIEVDGVTYAKSEVDNTDIAGDLPGGTFYTLTYWMEGFGALAHVEEDDTILVGLNKILDFLHVSGWRVGLAVFTVVAGIVLTVLTLIAMATDDPKLANALTIVNDVFEGLESIYNLVTSLSALLSSKEGVVEPEEIEMKEMGSLPEDFQVGDAIADSKIAGEVDTITSTTDKAMTFSDALSIIGLIVAVAIIIGTLIYFIAKHPHDSIAIGMAVAEAVAAIIVTVLIFLIGLIPVVGEIIEALIYILDLLVELIVYLITGKDFDFLSWIIEKLAWLFFHVDQLIKMDNQATGGLTSSLTYPDEGTVDGNTFSMAAQITTTLITTGAGNSGDIRDSHAYGYWDGSRTTDVTSSGANSASNTWCDHDGDTGYCYSTGSVSYLLKAMRNAGLEITQKVDYDLRVRKWVLFVPWRSSVSGTAPTDDSDLQKATNTIYLDVLPNTVDGLWSWNQIDNLDPDSDGLTSAAETATYGTNPNLWDTDGDNLSDGYEVQGDSVVNDQAQGPNPLLADTDGDGLGDALELRYSTSPNQADSDNDGLTDDQEVCRYVKSGTSWLRHGGWTALIPSGGTIAQVPVCSNPNDPDADGDKLKDGQEKKSQTSPFAANSGLPLLGLAVTPFARGPQGQQGTYVAPGASLGITMTLVNQGTVPVDQALNLCLPGQMTNVKQTEGAAGTVSAGACGDPKGQRVQWPYSANAQLPVDGELNTFFTAKSDPSATTSSQGLLNVTLPYSKTVVTGTARVVIDADNPVATVTDPADGSAIRGTSYVVGGRATDATSWVTLLKVNLGGASGQWTNVFTATQPLNPWAATWTLPKTDGTYTLATQATDFVGHNSTGGNSTVVVDNTPPTVGINLTDGGWLTGLQSDGQGGATVNLTGTANDNLSGVVRVDISIDGRPFTPVTMTPATGHPLSATWSYAWEIGGIGAQGSHRIVARSVDRAGNVSALVGKQTVIDMVPPGSNLAAPLVGLPTGKAITLRGHADETANLAPEAVPQALTGTVDAVRDATVWLGAQGGTAARGLTWLGDFNGDGRSDLAVGLPGADGGAGLVALLYGRAGGWQVPLNEQNLADEDSSFAGRPGAALGNVIAPAGDFDGDGFADLVVGDPQSNRVFLVYGRPTGYGQNMPLTGAGNGRTVITGPAGATFGTWLAPAGDVNSDGRADLLLGSAGGTGHAYLLLGNATRPNAANVTTNAAAVAPLPAAGAPLIGVGDVNADRYADFVIADPANSFGGGGANKPALYLFLGSAIYAAPTPPSGPATLPLSRAAVIATGSGALGQQVTPVGDLDANGAADFTYSSGAGPQLVLGQPNGAGKIQALGGFGNVPYVAGVGDVNADGKSDLAVGQAGNMAKLVLGTANFPASPVSAATIISASLIAGLHPVAQADCNCDGSADMLVLPGAAVEAIQKDPPDTYPLRLADVQGRTPTNTDRVAVAARPEARLMASPATVYVSPLYCSGCANDGHVWQVDGFASIQAAIASGSLHVVLAPGTYREAFSLASGVSIAGAGADATVLGLPAGGLGTAAGLVTANNVTGAQLSGVTLAGDGKANGLVLSGGAKQVTLRRSLVRNFGTGIGVNGAGSAVTLINDTVVNNGNGLAATGCGTVDVRNTIFAFNTLAGARYGVTGCPASLNRYNLFWRNGSGADLVIDGNPTDPSNVGQGQLVADPLFVDVSAGDYRLSTNSPAIEAGDVSDPPPPATGLRTDIGYAEEGSAAVYADLSYCATCPNDGLDWQVNAFGKVADALVAAGRRVAALGCTSASSGCPPVTVGVGAGVFKEAVTVPSNVELKGSGPDHTTLQGPGSGSVVTINNATRVRVGQLKLVGFGNTTNDAAVNIIGASSAITVTRNLIVGTTPTGGGSGVSFAPGAGGTVFQSTIVNVPNAVELDATGHLLAANNIFTQNGYALTINGSGGAAPQVISLNNLFYQNVRNYPAGIGTSVATDDLVNVNPQYVNAAGGDFSLQTSSPAIGAGTNSIAIADGGGTTDLGYAGSLVIPATLLFGREGETCATGNSGVGQVQLGLAPITSTSQPLTETIPTSWVTTALSATGQTGTAFSGKLTAGQGDGLYRLYHQSTDRAGNLQQAYLGTAVADSSIPAVAWLTPANGASISGAAVQLVAQAVDNVTVDGETLFNVSAIWFKVDGQLVQGQWLSPGQTLGTGPRRFDAAVALTAGNHSVQALAVDASGNIGQSDMRTISVTGSDVASLTVPPPGDQINAKTVPVQGFARFSGAGGTVTLYVDDQPAGTATLSNPGQPTSAFIGQVTLATEMSHTLKAVVGNGGPAGAVAVPVRLDLTPPTVSVSAPSNGFTTKGTVTFSGTASDGGSGLAGVAISVDGGVTWTAVPVTAGTGAFSWTWQPPGGTDNKPFPAVVRALDKAGNANLVNRTVVVDNTAPQSPGVTFQYCTPQSKQPCPPSPAIAPGATISSTGELVINWTTPVIDGSGAAKAGVIVNQTGNAPPASSAFKLTTPPVKQSFLPPPLTKTGAWYVHVGYWDNLSNYGVGTYGPFVYTPKTLLATESGDTSQVAERAGTSRSALPNLPILTALDGTGATLQAPTSQPMASTPEVVIATRTSFAARTGRHTFTGFGYDHGGLGLVRVEARGNGGPWHIARGTHHWSVTLDVPAAGSYLLEVRAIAADGSISQLATANVAIDNTAPTVDITVSATDVAYVIAVDAVAGDVVPPGTAVAKVQVQAEGRGWRNATYLGTVTGEPHWRINWITPPKATTMRFRARAVDFAGNVSNTTEWMKHQDMVKEEVNLKIDVVAPLAIAPGGTASYIVHVVNMGALTAINVQLVDSLPGGVDLLDADPACHLQANTLVCGLGNMFAGARQNITFQVRLRRGELPSRLLNVAVVSTDTVEADLSNNRVESTTLLGALLFLPRLDHP